MTIIKRKWWRYLYIWCRLVTINFPVVQLVIHLAELLKAKLVLPHQIFLHNSSVTNTITTRICIVPHTGDVPAHKTLNCQVNLSLCRPPSTQWHRRPGRPFNRWVEQIRNDNNLPPADLWRRAVSCGHRGATLRPLLATRWQQHIQFWTAAFHKQKS